jgi:hypothetical protein
MQRISIAFIRNALLFLTALLCLSVCTSFFVAGYTFNLPLHLNTGLAGLVCALFQGVVLVFLVIYRIRHGKKLHGTGETRYIRHALIGVGGSLALLVVVPLVGLDLLPGRWLFYTLLDTQAVADDLNVLMHRLHILEDASQQFALEHFPHCKYAWQRLPDSTPVEKQVLLPETLCALHPQELVFESGLVIVQLYGGGPVTHEGIVMVRSSVSKKLSSRLPKGIVPLDQRAGLYRYTLYDYRIVFNMIVEEP